MDASKRDPLRGELQARIIAVATAALKAPPLAHVLEGPRMLTQSRRAVDRILSLSMAYRMTGETRFLEKARSTLLTVSAFPDWNPSHFLDVAEMSLAVAVGYDWLYASLSPGDRETIRAALDQKALSFAAAAYTPGPERDPRLFFATARMNWNQVCNGGLLAAALAVGEDEPGTLRRVVAGVRASLPLAMAAYEPDGAYPEGPAYWAYGTDYNAIILSLLGDTLGTDYGLGAGPAFGSTVRYRMLVEGPSGYAFNYADGSSRFEDTPAYGWLATRYGDRVAMAHSRELLRKEIAEGREDRLLALAMAWIPEDPGSVAADMAKMPLSSHLRGSADIALFRSAWDDPRAVFVGFKAGYNGTNHAHLDLGSFVMEADGVRWAIDLGPDDYNLPGYFGEGRWHYFRLNNRSHNTVTPGNLLQDAKATAPIVAFSDAPDHPFAVADLTPAYPRAARRILRGVALEGKSRVLVQDDVSGLAHGTPLHWSLMTAATVHLSPDGRAALLRQSGRQLRIDILEPSGGAFRVRHARPPTFSENQNTGDSQILLDATSGTGEVRIAVLFTPIGDRWPAWERPVVTPVSDWR